MFCEKCGTKVEDNATSCQKCGATIVDQNDRPSDWFTFFCSLCPPLGVILYLCSKNIRPRQARSCIMGALIGFIVELIICLPIAVSLLINLIKTI